jgi:uncharacterized LabA/DUF88 family protein
MRVEPAVKRTIAFVDGQNLYRNVLNTFCCTHPNYNVEKLANAVCAARGWQLDQVNFYTGVPSVADNPRWNAFWTKKLAAIGRSPKTKVYSRPLVYRNKTIQVPGFGPHTALSGEEKGIDVRLALDVLDAAHRGEFDVALIFSQDQDLSELADIIRRVADLQNRWIKIAIAFPYSPTAPNKRGIDHTDWRQIDQATYDACIDPRDYR